MIYINRYNLDSTPAESFESIYGFKARCALPGWLQKWEFNVVARSERAAQRAADDHYGHRMMVYREPMRNLVQGYTRKITAEGRIVSYEGNGTWSRFDDQYHTTDIEPDSSISEVLIELLGSVPAVRLDAEYIVSNTTVVEEFGTDAIADGPGIRPGASIVNLLDMSNVNVDDYLQYDFWTEVVDQGLKPNVSKDRAHYAVRDEEPAQVDFVLRLSDLTAGRVTSDIYDLTTDVQIRYGKLTGSHDGPNGHQYLTDTTVDFRALGVTSGDYVLNKTKTLSLGFPVFMYVADIINDGHTLTGGAGYTWATADDYVVKLQTLGRATATASGTTNYWAVQGAPVEAPELTFSQAVQLANSFVERLSVPVVHIPFTVGVDRIRKPSGVQVSAWELLRRPYTIAVEDDRNLIAGMGYSLPGRTAFYTVAVDADYDQGVITLTMGEDKRLDQLLQRAGITGGQAIQPEPRGTPGPAGIGPYDTPWWLNRSARNQVIRREGGWDPSWIGNEGMAPEGYYS